MSPLPKPTRFHRMVHPASLALVLLGLLMPATRAQQSSAPGLTFQTNRYFKATPDESLFLKSGENEFVEIDLPRMNFSSSYQHKGPRALVFGTKTEKDGQTLFKPLATAKVPDTLRKAYLIFLPAGKTARLPYRVHVLDASQTGFSGGSAVYFNLSQRNIAGKLGTRELKLRPGAVQMLEGIPGQRYYVDLRYHKDERWLPLCKSYWEDDPSFRQVVLIFDDPKSKRTRFLSISDRVSSESPPSGGNP